MSLRMSSYANADVHVEILLWLIMTFITLTTCASRTSGECWTWLICADNKLTLQVRQVDFHKKFKHISARVNHCCHRPSGENYQMTTIGSTETEAALQPNGKLSTKLLELNNTIELWQKKWSNRTQSNFDWIRLGWMVKLAYIRLKIIKNDNSR